MRPKYNNVILLLRSDDYFNLILSWKIMDQNDQHLGIPGEAAGMMQASMVPFFPLIHTLKAFKGKWIYYPLSLLLSAQTIGMNQTPCTK